MCTIAVASTIPGSGARTNVSGVSKRWSARCALRVCPRCCIVGKGWPHEPSAMLIRDDAVMKNRFTTQYGLPHSAAECRSQIRRLLVPLEQVLRGERGGCGHVDEHKIGIVADLDRALVGKLKALRGKAGGETGDLSMIKAARRPEACATSCQQYGQGRLHSGDAAPDCEEIRARLH